MLHTNVCSILSSGDMRFIFVPKYKSRINFYLSNPTFNLSLIDVLKKISDALLHFLYLFIEYYITCINVFFKNIVMLSILKSFEYKVTFIVMSNLYEIARHCLNLKLTTPHKGLIILAHDHKWLVRVLISTLFLG